MRMDFAITSTRRMMILIGLLTKDQPVRLVPDLALIIQLEHQKGLTSILRHQVLVNKTRRQYLRVNSSKLLLDKNVA